MNPLNVIVEVCLCKSENRSSSFFILHKKRLFPIDPFIGMTYKLNLPNVAKNLFGKVTNVILSEDNQIEVEVDVVCKELADNGVKEVIIYELKKQGWVDLDEELK